MSVTIAVSYGELIDKMTILEIKTTQVRDPAKLKHIQHELLLLEKVWTDHVKPDSIVRPLIDELRAVNVKLWEIEDKIREKERQKIFDEDFISLARSVYMTNDQRSSIKRKLNEILHSEIMEEKDYRPY